MDPDCRGNVAITVTDKSCRGNVAITVRHMIDRSYCQGNVAITVRDKSDSVVGLWWAESVYVVSILKRNTEMHLVSAEPHSLIGLPSGMNVM